MNTRATNAKMLKEKYNYFVFVSLTRQRTYIKSKMGLNFTVNQTLYGIIYLC